MHFVSSQGTIEVCIGSRHLVISVNEIIATDNNKLAVLTVSIACTILPTYLCRQRQRYAVGLLVRVAAGDSAEDETAGERCGAVPRGDISDEANHRLAAVGRRRFLPL